VWIGTWLSYINLNASYFTETLQSTLFAEKGMYETTFFSANHYGLLIERLLVEANGKRSSLPSSPL